MGLAPSAMRSALQRRALQSAAESTPSQAARRFVAVMQSADFGQLDDLAGGARLDRPRPWGVLAEAQMCARSVVVVEVLSEDSVKMSLVEHHDVIETLPPHRADQTLDVGILPG